MKNKTKIKIGIIVGSIIFMLLVSYVGLAEYYKNGFCYGTWINDVYCTGKSVEEVNRELRKGCSYEGLTVYDNKGNAFRIEAEEIGYTFDFQESLQSYLASQDPYLWIGQLFTAGRRELKPVVSYDEGRLQEILGPMPVFTEKKEADRKVFIEKTKEGYSLVDERKNAFREEKAKEAIRQSLLSFATELDLAAAGCYEDLPYTEKMQEELACWEKIKEFQDCHIVYALGEERVTVDASVACDWIALDETGEFLYDEAGNLQADETKIEEFINCLADAYDTVGGTHYFNATRGERVVVEGGTYGNKIDRKAEIEYLKQAFAGKVDEVHTPAYLQTGWKQGKDDIGSTYIEVDMTEQMMYYYLDGRLEVETPIVTGNTGRRWGTPAGVNYVYGKARNRVLRGPGYESPVNFWMPVKGNIGIHDAPWRSEYGGEIYKTGGSHGCINTPYDAMSRIYEMAEIGTPVVMFY